MGSSPLTRGKRSKLGATAAVGGLIPAHAGKTNAYPPREGGPEAHPRSRGENFQMGIPRSANWGSSPLTRGKRFLQLKADRHRRLIPAHAGKTFAPIWGLITGEAHPRSRGENLVAAVDTMPDTGSSPLTRGKPRLARSASKPKRLIPAHAGKTCWYTPRWVRYTAHPRSRGENPSRPYGRPESGGSSPLTRGKLGRT